MIYWFEMVPSGFELIAPAAIFLVSIYTFANVNMKTEDYYFRGFPAVWNIVVLYFFIFVGLEFSLYCQYLLIAALAFPVFAKLNQ